MTMHHPERASLTWRKSSYSLANGGCVALATDGDRWYVADTKNPNGPTLTVPHAAWDHFQELAGLREQSRGGDTIKPV